MAITQAIANSFKKQLLDGDQDFTAAPAGDIFKIALYTSSATLNSATTSLLTSAPTNEVPNSGQYTAGGGKKIARRRRRRKNFFYCTQQNNNYFSV